MADRPNILIFMTDHQRADTVLPEHPAITPNLDKMAQQGALLTNCFTSGPHCCPARASFMTGVYPTRHGVWNNICNGQRLSRGIHRDVKCWSEDLAGAGYHMSYNGKWHVSIDEMPGDRGWTVENRISGHTPNAHGTSWEAWQKRAQTPDPAERPEGGILRPGYSTYTLYGEFDREREAKSNDHLLVDDAVRQIEQNADRDEPWVVYVTTGAPHDPYFAPADLVDLYDLDDVPLPASFADEMSDKPQIVQRMRRQIFGQLSEREVRQGVRHFWAMCTWLDELFGKLLAALDRTGQAEDTLVVYTADHGDYCGDHGLFAKGIPCYRGAYNTPAVVRWPAGVRNPGRRVDEFVSICDFHPTFQEAAGLPADPTGTARDGGITGRSLLPFLRDEAPADWREEIWTQCNGVELYYTQRSVMTRDFKYVFNGFDRDELYDLRRDPDEIVNVAEDADYRDVLHDMVCRMWRFAHAEADTAFNPYITVGLAPWGPAEYFRHFGAETT